MLRLFPDLSDDLLMRLYHKGAHVHWTSEDIDWEAPVSLDERASLALARVLSPVYLGEQSAMVGAANVLPQLAMAGEANAQLYLTTFIGDEARHFEVLTRLYHRLGYEPVSIRALPAMLRYHHRLRQGDRVDWVWGILISDLFAKHFYQMFSHAQENLLFGSMSQRILVDESRHQAFCDHYLTGVMPHLGPERRQALRSMRDELLSIMEDMQAVLGEDAEALGFSGQEMLDRVMSDVAAHAKRIGLDGGPSPVGGRRQPGAEAVDLAARRRQRAAEAADRPLQSRTTGPECDCTACPIAAICSSRLVRRAAAR